MEEILKPGIGFTPETKQTLLAHKHKTTLTGTVVPGSECHDSNSSEKSSLDLIQTACIDIGNVTDCAIPVSSINQIQISTEYLSNTLRDETNTSQHETTRKTEMRKVNRVDVIPNSMLEINGAQSRGCDFEKISKSPNTCSDTDQCGVANPVPDQMPNVNLKTKMRKGASLSFDDLEYDTIHPIACKTTVLPDIPDSVAEDLPRITLEKGGRRGSFLRQAEAGSVVYIQHSLATDSDLGDRFGAKIETIPTPGDKYFEHFLTNIEKRGVAEHMKIRPGDQLVLLNGTFLPDFDHQTVLQLFSGVPVDSHTRLSLVLLRHIDKNRWVWINTSAILVPEYHSEPAVKEPHFGESYSSSDDKRHLVKLKVQGTCLFIAIDDGHVRIEVSECDVDMARYDICVWERCRLDNNTGRLSYSACLYRQSQTNQYQNDYLTVDCTQGVTCLLKPEPQWFGFGLLGNTMSFKDTELNKWLCCDVTNAVSGTFGLRKDSYYFNFYPVETKLGIDDKSVNTTTHHHRVTSDSVGVPPEGTDVDKPCRKLVSVSQESLSNISANDSGYGHSRQSSYAL